MRSNIQAYDFPVQRVPNSRKKEEDWYAACCDWVIAQGLANRDSNELEVKYLIKNTNIKITEEFASETSIVLKNKNIIEGSIEFSDSENFHHNVNSLEDIKNSGLIKLTMGNFDRPVTKYLYVNEGKISYYQGNPLPTSANIDAHKKLKEILSK